MYVYLVRRLIRRCPSWSSSASSSSRFSISRPAIPRRSIAGDLATAADIAKIRQKLGLDEPFLVRFAHMVVGPAARRSRRLDLLQSSGVAADRPAHRADPGARHDHHALRRSPGGADGRSRGLEGGHLDRPRSSWASPCSASPSRSSSRPTCLIYGFSIRLEWLPVEGYSTSARRLLGRSSPISSCRAWRWGRSTWR